MKLFKSILKNLATATGLALCGSNLTAAPITLRMEFETIQGLPVVGGIRSVFVKLTIDSEDLRVTDQRQGVYTLLSADIDICTHTPVCYSLLGWGGALADHLFEYNVSLHGGHAIYGALPIVRMTPDLPWNPTYPYMPPPTPTRLEFTLFDADNTALTNDSATGPVAFHAFEYARFDIAFRNQVPFGPSFNLTGQVTSFENVRGVPEPSSFLCLLLAMAALAVSSRRRRVR